MGEDESQQTLETSKSQRKRDLIALQGLATQLMNLSAAQLARMPLNEPILLALVEVGRMRSKPAIRRQVRFVAQLLDKIDSEAVYHAVEELRKPHQQSVAQFHELEQWRDRMLRDGNSAIDEYMASQPSVDRQQLRQLVRNAQKEIQQGKKPLSSKKIFQLLKHAATLD